ncbi:phage regulatory CII family protein [Halopseudomonas oceani]|uniref:phage regulatory CII family protein n=1 Tax=Halopseudomonas oceani TaxID=1708783 RepID=UPI000C8C8578|nr:phage regulatory CII family protein [Halopseudomonas oceani]MAC99689.1 hypothetical protein [Pseudomonadales bacterium]
MSRKDLLPDAGPVLSIRAALYRACRDDRAGITGVALSMGIDPDALQKVVNPKDRRPIAPEWIEDILSHTQDPRLVAALVRPAGALAFVPQPVPATREALRALADLLREEGEFVESLTEGAADSRWEPHEVERLRYHANQLVGRILGIVAGAEQAMEGCDHA